MVRLSFREQVLNEVEDGRVSAMPFLGEQGRDLTFRFRHQVICDDRVSRPRIEQ